MKQNNAMHFCIIYRPQLVDGASGTQTPMRGAHRYLRLDVTLPQPPKDMNENVGEESDDDAAMGFLDERMFLMSYTGFWKFEKKLPSRVNRLQWYNEVMGNQTLHLIADYMYSVIDDKNVAWLYKQCHIVYPPAAGCLANRQHTSSPLVAIPSLWGWNPLCGLLFNDSHWRWVFFWNFGGWTDVW